MVTEWRPWLVATVASICLLLVTTTCHAWSGGQQPVSRGGFWAETLTTTIATFVFPSPVPTTATLSLPMTFLPVAGCWALKVTLEDKDHRNFNYYGVVDTGSPFLTAPTVVTSMTQPTRYQASQEQYGEFLDAMTWRRSDYVTMVGNGSLLEQRQVVVGIPSPEVVSATGGVFVGLINKDDNRPTFLQQFGYHSFALQFLRPAGDEVSVQKETTTPTFRSQIPKIVLSKQEMIQADDPESLKLFDMRPYGPDLYHYGVLCQSLVLEWRQENDAMATTKPQRVHVASLQRPVVAILDTGLTGCILSDSLTNELGLSVEQLAQIQGIQVSLPMRSAGGEVQTLSSSEKYWNLDSFRLPWFLDEDRHPHVIALGGTYWANGGVESLTIDTQSRRAKIVVTTTKATMLAGD